jgi:hypothetical protein
MRVSFSRKELSTLEKDVLTPQKSFSPSRKRVEMTPNSVSIAPESVEKPPKFLEFAPEALALAAKSLAERDNIHAAPAKSSEAINESLRPPGERPAACPFPHRRPRSFDKPPRILPSLQCAHNHPRSDGKLRRRPRMSGGASPIR